MDKNYSAAVADLVTGKVDLAVKALTSKFLDVDLHKQIVMDKVGAVLLREAQNLCAKSSPSILRGIEKEQLKELTLEKFASELEVSINC